MQYSSVKRSYTNEPKRQLAAEAELARKLTAIAEKALTIAIEEANFDPQLAVPTWIINRLVELDQDIYDITHHYDLDPLLNIELENFRSARRELRLERDRLEQPCLELCANWRKTAQSLEKAIKRARRCPTDRERLQVLVDSGLKEAGNLLAGNEIKLIREADLHLSHTAAVAVPSKDDVISAPKPEPVAHVDKIGLPARVEIDQGAFDIITRAKSGLFDTLEDHSLNRTAQHLSLVTGFDALLCLPLLTHIEQFPFQVNTARQVMRTMRGRALLCDEVGLGKTIEAGLILKEYLLRGLARKVLVLTPPALVSQWAEEMKDKFGISFVTHLDTEFRSLGAGAWCQHDRVIASLSTAKSRVNSPEIQEIPYDIVIVDEAHHLRNRDTVNWKFVNGIKTKYILLLTATPAQNNLDELFNLITLLSPGRLKTIAGFRREFVDKKDARLPKNRTKLQELLMDVMIRNTRSQVNIALPPRKAITKRVELSQAERKLYDGVSALVRDTHGKSGERRMIGQTLLNEVGSSGQAVAATLTKMRGRHPDLENRIDHLSNLAASVTESSKQIALVALMNEAPEKALIFTQFRETQKALFDALTGAGVSAARFDGTMNAVEKDRQVRLFTEESQVLISTDVGSEGRNLQFCHTIINYDLPWNPMRIEQRVGRVHRIGQTETVKILNFAARDTVEDYVLQVLDSKINMFELVIGEIGEILGNLDEDQEFDEIVYDLWSSASSTDDVKVAFNQFGDQLLEARQRYSETKAYDEALFGNEFEAEE